MKVEIPNSAGNGTDYELVDGVLSVNSGFTGSITAEYTFTTSPTREIDFGYDHNGLRTQKKIVENGITTIYDYTLHGKLITHLTKRTVNEEGIETEIDELHFFYDAQSRPTFVEYNGVKYRYIHNLQCDIVGILDNSGALVVEYKYDVWGTPLSASGTLKTSLGKLNLFRYRGYVFDAETELYYLRSRYYNATLFKFISSDTHIVQAMFKCNVYNYALNSPLNMSDTDGTEPTYTVVLNVYGEDYLKGTGHYDISIISETDQNCIFTYGDTTFNTDSSGMTLSFGNMDKETIEVAGKEIQTGSRVDIYTEPERKLSKEGGRYTLVEGLTQTSLNRFMNWFGKAYANPDDYNDAEKRLRCKVFAKGHTTYSVEDGPYCGSEAMFLVSVLINATYGTRARVAPGTKAIVGYLTSGVRTVGEGHKIIQMTLKTYAP